MKKLVRDKIPDIIWEQGHIPITKVVEGDELADALNEKLREEVQEWIDSDTDAEELADILEVLMAIARHHGILWSDIEEARVKKARDRGIFSEGIIWLGNVR